VATVLRLLVRTIVLGAGTYGVYYGISTGAITKDTISTSIARVTQWLKGSTPPPATTKRIIPVETTTAHKGNMDLYLKQLGSVTALYTVTLHCRVDGELYKVAFTEGQMVQQGDLLAEIDPRPFQVQLKQAEGNLLRDQASLKVALLDMDRYMALLGSRSVTQQQVDAQKALIQQSEGAIKTDEGLIESSKLNLKYCRITAPISGRIGLRMVDPGNIVHANDMSGLAVITQLQPITVVFTIPQDDIARVQRKLNAGEQLVVDAFDREFTTKLATGKLMAIDNQVDTTTGTVRLKAIFDNEDNMLFPNQFVNARLLVDVRHDAVIVPSAAVQRGPNDSTFVYVVKADESVELRNVAVGPSESDQSVIDSGVEPGDVVVVNGVDKLQPGTKVAARDRNAPPEDGKAKLAESNNNGRPDTGRPKDGHGNGESNQRAGNQRGLAERPGVRSSE
jgi:multidrug efflux system membrane fusion protein